MLLAPHLSSSTITAALYKLHMTTDHDSVYWEEVGRLNNICWQPDIHPSIFGLSNSTSLIMGYVQGLSTDSNASTVFSKGKSCSVRDVLLDNNLLLSYIIVGVY